MEIKSPDFNNNSKIPIRFTGDGEDINPNLELIGVPTNTKSLVLIIDDPDAPMSVWNHWLLWDIDPKTTKIKEKSVPIGAMQGKNNYSKNSYGGPKPPSGTHRYFFRLYALDCRIILTKEATRRELERAIYEHVIAKAGLIGLYR
jgi:Raf kinase inhibitor-like YbhB/YbcL family protein